MNTNHTCLMFEEIDFTEGFLDYSVDATYVIYLEGSDRINNIDEQLQKFQPTKKIFILRNKGYRCKENPVISKSHLDLVDCYLHIFSHSRRQNFENILILEDDFFFSEKILNKKVLRDINNFLFSLKEDTSVYFLGCLPFFFIPYNKTHYRNILSLGTHAVIYTKNIREKIDKKHITNIQDWDKELHMYKRFSYHESLCYQLFPNTENSMNWIDYGQVSILKGIIKFYNLDKKPEPGYSRCYVFAKFIFFILLIILFFLIRAIYKKFI